MGIARREDTPGSGTATVLAQGLIEDDTRGHGKIEASHIGVGHGQGVAAIYVKTDYFCRQPSGFAAEYQVVPRAKNGIGVWGVDLCAEEEQLLLRLSFQKTVQIVPVHDGNMPPVVKAGPFQVLVVDVKSQGFDKVEICIRSAA